jgi:hypothetical protein
LVKKLKKMGLLMNDRQQANKLLDRHKETGELSYADTTRALRATGDIEADGGERVDFETQEENQRPWENESIRMVVADLIRHGEKAWITRH